MVNNKSNWVTATKIYRLRMEAGMSQGDLAGKLDVEAAEVGRWEKGNLPDEAVMRKLAEVLGTSLEELTS